MAINATAVWRIRPSGSNTNGGGYDPGIAGAGTDYSQQNVAQATGSHGTATGTTTFTDTTAAAFTSAMVGNALWIASGAGFTTGAYFVITFNSATSIVLDRSPGTGTVAAWKIGGGWADFTNVNSGPLVPGNNTFVLGSGIPNPSSYTYDYSPGATISVPNGDTTNGCITIAADPSTPSYNGTTSGGMPTIHVGGELWESPNFIIFKLIWTVLSGSGGTAHLNGFGNNSALIACVYDEMTFDFTIVGGTNPGGIIVGCEFFSSTGGAGTHNNPAINLSTFNYTVTECNLHDWNGPGIITTSSFVFKNNIIAKNNGYGINLNYTGGGDVALLVNNTIDGNTGDGITTKTVVPMIYNNLITNQTGAGKFGLNVTTGTTAVNDRIKQFVDYNSYYNNTSSYNAISAGVHDTALGASPYVAQSTENYTLASP